MKDSEFFSHDLLEKQIKIFQLKEFDSIKLENKHSPVFSATGIAVLKIDGVWMHSKHDPAKESRRLIETVHPENKEQIVVFFGAGLGYSVMEFCHRWPNPVYWLELDFQIHIQALAVLDFSGFKNQIRFINSVTKMGDEMDIVNNHLSDSRILNITKGRSNEDVIFVSHRNSYRINPGFQSLQKSFENYLNKKSVNIATMSRFDRLWTHNLVRNYHILSKARPIGELFGSLDKAPVIICGAGPSLETDIEQIKELSKSCIVLCVDTALHVLESHEIYPDIVICVDPQSINQYHLEFLRSKDAIFVVEPTTSPQSLRQIPQDRLYFMQSPFVLASILNDSFDQEIGQIAFGGSVSTNAYDLAIKMGSLNILMFGQDFAFSYKKAHASGAKLEERLNFLENRFFRRELHNYKQLFALPVRLVQGKKSNKIPTNDKLMIFLQWFEKRIAQDAVREIQVFDLKSEGARLQSTHTDFESLIPATKAQIKTKDHSQFNQCKFMKSIEDCIKGLDKVKNISCEASMISKDLMEMWKSDHKNDTFKKKLKHLDILDLELNSLESYSKIAGLLIQKIIYSLTGESTIQSEQGESSNEYLQSLVNSNKLYCGLSEASRDLIYWLQKSIRQFESDSI